VLGWSGSKAAQLEQGSLTRGQLGSNARALDDVVERELRTFNPKLEVPKFYGAPPHMESPRNGSRTARKDDDELVLVNAGESVMENKILPWPALEEQLRERVYALASGLTGTRRFSTARGHLANVSV
jgi:hypothetical protein